jgi:hypothetical protein
MAVRASRVAAVHNVNSRQAGAKRKGYDLRHAAIGTTTFQES